MAKINTNNKKKNSKIGKIFFGKDQGVSSTCKINMVRYVLVVEMENQMWRWWRGAQISQLYIWELALTELHIVS